jgi:hypothetical protein
MEKLSETSYIFTCEMERRRYRIQTRPEVKIPYENLVGFKTVTK